MIIDKKTATCAAQHIIAAHNSHCDGEPVDFARPCEECPCRADCKCDWLEILRGIFDEAGVGPKVMR